MYTLSFPDLQEFISLSNISELFYPNTLQLPLTLQQQALHTLECVLVKNLCIQAVTLRTVQSLLFLHRSSSGFCLCCWTATAIWNLKSFHFCAKLCIQLQTTTETIHMLNWFSPILRVFNRLWPSFLERHNSGLWGYRSFSLALQISNCTLSSFTHVTEDMEPDCLTFLIRQDLTFW